MDLCLDPDFEVWLHFGHWSIVTDSCWWLIVELEMTVQLKLTTFWWIDQLHRWCYIAFFVDSRRPHRMHPALLVCPVTVMMSERSIPWLCNFLKSVFLAVWFVKRFSGHNSCKGELIFIIFIISPMAFFPIGWALNQISLAGFLWPVGKTCPSPCTRLVVLIWTTWKASRHTGDHLLQTF